MKDLKKQSLEIHLEEIELLIRRAEVGAALESLSLILEAPISPSFLARVSQLFTRCGRPIQAVRLLHRTIRPRGKKLGGGSTMEKTEYAAALSFLGANEEALEILIGINPQEIPKVLLYQAFCYFAKWEYANAIPLLEQYCSLQSLECYDRVVGELNLAAALVQASKGDEKAKSILEGILETSQKNEFRLIRGIAFETAAQNEIFHGREQAALVYLGEAEKLLKEKLFIGALFVRKWKAILQIRNPDTQKLGLAALNAVRACAMELSHWETVRDCDRFQALYTKDRSLLSTVYFGTPYPDFRQEILEQDLFPVVLPSVGRWNLGETAGVREEIDFERAMLEASGGKSLSPLLATLFATFTSDFYRPWSIPSLFSKLYPKEYFNPISSHARVHRAIQRLRQCFKRAKLPLLIAERDSFYRLEAIVPVSILIPTEMKHKGNNALVAMRSHFSHRTFSITEANAVVGLSKRTILRILVAASKANKLKRIGAGRSTGYRFVA